MAGQVRKAREAAHLTTALIQQTRTDTKEFERRSLAPNEWRGFRLPYRYATRNLLLTPDAAWAGTQIPMKNWGFLSDEDKRALVEYLKTL